jgi:hypothetical protein
MFSALNIIFDIMCMEILNIFIGWKWSFFFLSLFLNKTKTRVYRNII